MYDIVACSAAVGSHTSMYSCVFQPVWQSELLWPLDMYTWRLWLPLPMFLHHPTTSTGMWSLSLTCECMLTPILLGCEHDLPSIRSSQLHHAPPLLLLARTPGSCPTSNGGENCSTFC